MSVFKNIMAAAPDNCEEGCALNLPKIAATEASLQNILATIFGVIGAIAVIVIIISAINFITSEGEPEKIMRARKAIIYSLVGLGVAILAEAIVFTVLGRL